MKKISLSSHEKTDHNKTKHELLALKRFEVLIIDKSLGFACDSTLNRLLESQAKPSDLSIESQAKPSEFSIVS